MANSNPVKARQAKRQKRQKKAEAAGTVDDLRLKLWKALAADDDVLADAKAEPTLKLKALHALTQASGAYLKIIEVGELEARMKAIEERLAKGSVF